jgi:hypothetical protein
MKRSSDLALLDETRLLELTIFVSAADVQRALGCSRSMAYEHLRHAAGRDFGDRGMLRVSIPIWEAYVEEVFGCGSTSEARSGGAHSTKTEFGDRSRPSAKTKRRQSESLDRSSEMQQIPITRPRRRRS